MGRRGDDPCLRFRFFGEKGFAGAGSADVTVSPKAAFCPRAGGGRAVCVVLVWVLEAGALWGLEARGER